MTEAQTKKRFRQLDREQSHYEAKWLPRIQEAIEKQIEPVYEALEKYGPRYVLNNIDTLVLPDPLQPVLKALWVDVGVKAANSEYGHLKRSYRNDIKSIRLPVINIKAFGFNKFWSGLMANLFDLFAGFKISNITRTERDRIARILLESESESQQYEDWFLLSRRIRTDNIPLVRARLITRTESGFAASAGGEIGARQSGLIMAKKWISIRDKRSRTKPRDQTDHYSMYGTTVGMEEKFLVPNKRGFDLMSRPHDPDAPAAQVCNCRCKCVYVPMRGPDGRLLRSTPLGGPSLQRLR